MPNWSEFRYFTRHENWGVPSRMSVKLIHLLDQARDIIGSPFIITDGYNTDRTKNSLHRTGKAADLVIPYTTRHPLDILINLERLDWGGLGYYPDWKYKGKTVGGWHLDVREKEKHAGGARWMGVSDSESDKQKYVALNYKNLVKYGVIR